jgi:hypothetical protein
MASLVYFAMNSSCLASSVGSISVSFASDRQRTPVPAEHTRPNARGTRKSARQCPWTGEAGAVTLHAWLEGEPSGRETRPGMPGEGPR